LGIWSAGARSRFISGGLPPRSQASMTAWGLFMAMCLQEQAPATQSGGKPPHSKYPRWYRMHHLECGSSLPLWLAVACRRAPRHQLPHGDCSWLCVCRRKLLQPKAAASRRTPNILDGTGCTIWSAGACRRAPRHQLPHGDCSWPCVCRSKLLQFKAAASHRTPNILDGTGCTIWSAGACSRFA